MQVRIRAVPNARKSEVTEIAPGEFRVRVDAPPEGGRANARVLEILAEHLGVPGRKLRLIRGQAGRNKIVEVER